MSPTTVAVVGAGIAGLAAARAHERAGRRVVLFDKGRSAGGRVATRRGQEFAFDHGAQFFTIRSSEFATALAPAIAARTVVPWAGPFRTAKDGVFGPDPRPGARRWVAVPGMSGLARALAEGLDVRTGQRVERLARRALGWDVAVRDLASDTNRDEGPFDEVVLALPAPQAHALLLESDVQSPVVERAAALATALSPCLCALVAFETPIERAAGGLFVDDPVLAWAAHDGGKPGRGNAATYVLHGAGAWSRAHVDDEPLVSARALLAAFERVLGAALPPIRHLEGHRWRYALPGATAPADASARDGDLALALCGDAFTAGRVEGAFTSGHALGMPG
jgi:predicted NAD/FAD-dependent oxidoreductase